MPTFPDALKNVVPSLEKATEVTFVLLLTSFFLLADCAALFVHGMNLLHLADMPDVIKPRLAIEAVILIIVFGVFMAIVMEFVAITANEIAIETVWRLWFWIVTKLDPDRNPFRLESANAVHLHNLRTKAHKSKETYYLDLFKEADENENEYFAILRKNSNYALAALLLGCVDLFAPLSPGTTSVLAEIADGLGHSGYSLLFLLGCFLLIVAFYPIFEDRHPTVYCPELARELDEEEQRKREERAKFDREIEARRADRGRQRRSWQSIMAVRFRARPCAVG
jgi:hypothetical protein